MEMFIGVIVLFLIVAIICTISSFMMLIQVKKNQQKTFHMFSSLLQEIASLRKVIGTKPPIKVEKEKEAKTFTEKVVTLNEKKTSTTPSIIDTPTIKKPEIEHALPPPIPKRDIVKNLQKTSPTKESVSIKTEIPPTVPTRTPSSFERRAEEILTKTWNWIVVGEEFRNPNVSIEYAIAVPWMIRIGVIVLVIAGVFAINLSIERGLVGPIGRVCGILLAGVSMVSVGLKLANKKYHALAQGLIGGGIALLYVGVFSGFSMFKIIDPILAFVLMIFITLTAGVIAIRLNSLLIAILGVIGGYMTPMLINSGTGNLPGLFTYIILLGICTLAIAKYRDWKLLNALAFIFTYLLFFLSINKYYNSGDFSMVITFLSLFFILFSFIPILYNIINKEKSTIIELLFMFFNASVFFPTAYYLILELYSKEYVAIVTISLALFYILQIYLFLMKKIQDRNFLIMLSGFASFFITFTIPLLLSNEWITTAWAIQALIFMWMSKKMKSNIVRVIAHILYFITFGRLMIFDFFDSCCNAPNLHYWSEMLNRFMTFGVTIISLYGSYYLLKQEKIDNSDIVNDSIANFKKNDIRELMGDSFMAKIFFWIVFAFIFVYLHFELYYFCDLYYPPIKITILSYIWIGTMIYLLSMCIKPSRNGISYILKLFIFFFLMKLLFVDLNFWKFSFDNYVYGIGEYSITGGVMRFLDFIPAIAFLSYLSYILVPIDEDKDENQIMQYQFFATLALILLFIYTSFEVNTFLSFKANGFRAGGVSILWSLFAIGFLISGILKQSKALRYSGLTLFVIVVAKIFLSDLSRLDQLYRIIAFIILGFIILAAACVYIKFKNFFAIGDTNDQE